MKYTSKKLIAFLMVLVMLLEAAPVSALAEGKGDASNAMEITQLSGNADGKTILPAGESQGTQLFGSKDEAIGEKEAEDITLRMNDLTVTEVTGEALNRLIALCGGQPDVTRSFNTKGFGQKGLSLNALTADKAADAGQPKTGYLAYEIEPKMVLTENQTYQVIVELPQPVEISDEGKVSLELFHIVGETAQKVSNVDFDFDRGTLYAFTFETSEGFSPFVIKYTVEFAYVEKTGNISLNFENANEKGNELGQLIRKNAQGQEEVAVTDILGLAAQAADPQSAAPYTLSLSDGAAWTGFDADFFAEAAVSIEGKGVEYSSGTIILAGDVESAAVTFAASHKTLELTLQNYTAPEKPVVPENEEGFAYRFYSESAAVEDILKECGIVSSYYNNVTVSDTALVTLDEKAWTLTANNYFGEVVLSLSLSDGTEIEIKLQNPAPVKAGETVTGEDGSFSANEDVPAGTKLVVDANPKVPEGITIGGAKKRGGPVESEPIFFDISLIGPDGNEVQTGANVTIPTDIKLPQEEGKLTKVAGVSVYHVDEKGYAEPLSDVDYALAEGRISSVSFATPGFSLFAITYTVEYIVSGQEYSIVGGGVMSLRELLSVLGVNIQIEEIQNVRFSNEELVQAAYVAEDTTAGALKKALGVEPSYSAELTEEDIAAMDAAVLTAPDWALISLKPFKTDETLTLLLTDGQEYEIAVTDGQIVRYYIDSKGDTYEITVTFEDDAEIPEDADLAVAEIDPESEAYQAYLAQAIQALTEEETAQVEYARFFDITIMNNGEKVTPKAPVSVSIRLADAPEGEELKVIHFDEAKGLVVMDAKEDGGDLQFEADSFSVYGVITYPTAQPQGVYDLGGRTFKISQNGRYMTASVYAWGNNSNQNRFSSTTEVSNAATWQFEATDTPDEYYIFTMVNENGNQVKKYLNLKTHGAVTTTGDAELRDTPQALKVTKDGDSYNIAVQLSRDSVTDWFYLSEERSDIGFTGIPTHNSPNTNLTLTFDDASNVTSTGTPYAVIIHYDGAYYAVKPDGSLESARYDAATNRVYISYPLLWNYELFSSSYNAYHLKMETEGKAFNGPGGIASQFYYRYICVNENSGLVSEDVSHQDQSWWGAITYENNQIHGIGDSVTKFIGVETDANNIPTRIAGNKTSSEAVEVILAEVKNESVPDSLARYHAVSHLDVSIHASAQVSYPLPRGTYYDQNGNPLFTVNKSHPKTVVVNSPVEVVKEDIKNATIIAKDKNGNVVENAYYITGYSGNKGEDEYNPNLPTQIRIEGSFKVASNVTTTYDPVWTDPENNHWTTEWDGLIYNERHQAIRNERLASPITYTVTTTKMVTFTLKDGDQVLYDENRNPITITVPVSLTGSCGYWDEKNECPGIGWNGVNCTWGGEVPFWAGCIVGDGGPASSGIDFTLAGSTKKEEDSYPSIDITKYIMDEDGNVLQTEGTLTHSFKVFQYDNTEHLYSDTNQAGAYTQIDTLPVQVSGGMGKNYLDLNVTSAMIYVEEDKASVPDTITVGGETWTYVKTVIETEYVRRSNEGDKPDNHTTGDMYRSVNEHYNSVPEVVGAFKVGEADFNDALLDFYVYNVYRKLSSVSVEKDWLDKDGYPLTDSTKYPSSVQVTLWCKNKSNSDPAFIAPNWAVGDNPKTLSATNGWKCEWTGLSKDYAYFVKETPIDSSYHFKPAVYKVNGATMNFDETSAGLQTIDQGTVQLINQSEETNISVKLRKCVTGDTKSPVVGAKFKVYNYVENLSNYSSETPITLNGNTEHETRYDGNFYIGYMQPGHYVMVETFTPTGYINRTTPIEFELSSTPIIDGTNYLMRYRDLSAAEWNYKAADSSGYYNLFVENDQETVDIEVTKVWKNADDSDMTSWPEGVTVDVQLYEGDTPVEGKTAQLSASQQSYTFTGLPQYRDGVEITNYNVKEAQILGYLTDITSVTTIDDQTGKKTYTYTITNTQYEENSLVIEVEKTWSGSGALPASITVALQKRKVGDDEWQNTGDTLVLNAGNAWKASFTGLSETEDDTLLEYRVQEAGVGGWTVSYSNNNGINVYSLSKKIEITNTRNPEPSSEKTRLIVQKQWEANGQLIQNPSDATEAVQVKLVRYEATASAGTLNIHVYEYDGNLIGSTEKTSATVSTSSSAALTFTFTPQTEGSYSWATSSSFNVYVYSVNPAGQFTYNLSAEEKQIGDPLTISGNSISINPAAYSDYDEIYIVIGQSFAQEAGTTASFLSDYSITGSSGGSVSANGEYTFDTDYQYVGSYTDEDGVTTLNSANSWQYEFTDLPKSGSGHVYKYAVVETGKGNGSVTTQYSVDGGSTWISEADWLVSGQNYPKEDYSFNAAQAVIVKNTRSTQEITVSKVWSDGNANHSSDSVTLRLIRFKKDGGAAPQPSGETGILNLTHTINASDGASLTPSDFTYTATNTSDSTTHSLRVGSNTLPVGTYNITVTGGSTPSGYTAGTPSVSPSQVTVTTSNTTSNPVSVTVTSEYTAQQSQGGDTITVTFQTVVETGCNNWYTNIYTLSPGTLSENAYRNSVPIAPVTATVPANTDISFYLEIGGSDSPVVKSISASPSVSISPSNSTGSGTRSFHSGTQNITITITIGKENNSGGNGGQNTGSEYASVIVYVGTYHSNSKTSNVGVQLTQVPKNTSVYLTYGIFQYSNYSKNEDWKLYYWNNSTWVETQTQGSGPASALPVSIGNEDEYLIEIFANEDYINNPGISLTLGNSSSNMLFQKKEFSLLASGGMSDAPLGFLRLPMLALAANYALPSGITVPDGYSLDLDFDQTVTLNSGNDWSETVSNLAIADGNGEAYYYAIVEENVPAGYTVSYSSQPLAATGSNITLTATNTITSQQPGAIKLKKIIQNNGVDDSSAGGDYFFSLQRVDANGQAQGEPIFINLWLTGNAIGDYRIMTSAAYDNGNGNFKANGEGVTYVSGNTDGYAVISNLVPGYYWLTELSNNHNKRAVSIERGDSEAAAVDLSRSRVKLQVAAGVTNPAANSAAAVTFINDNDKGIFKLKKVVTVDGSAPNGSTKADGAYLFTVRRSGDPNVLKYVWIIVKNGAMYTYAIHTNENIWHIESGWKRTLEDGWAIVDNNGKLTVGDYVVEEQGHGYLYTEDNSGYISIDEQSPLAGVTLTGITGGVVSDDSTTVTISPTNSDQVTFTNNKDTNGSLEITKAFLPGSASDGANRDFTFKVRLYGGSNYEAFNGDVIVSDKTRTETTVTPQQGHDAAENRDYRYVTVTVTGAGTAVIAGLPEGTVYQVEEEDPNDANQGNWFCFSVTPDEGTIAESARSTVTVTNTRLGILKIEKSIKDADDKNITVSPMPTFPIVISTIIDGTPYYVQNDLGDLGTTPPDESLMVTAGQQLQINYLPYGVYTIAETEPDSVVVGEYSFASATITGDNPPTGEGTISINGSHNEGLVSITNTYSCIALTLKKVVEADTSYPVSGDMTKTNGYYYFTVKDASDNIVRYVWIKATSTFMGEDAKPKYTTAYQYMISDTAISAWDVDSAQDMGAEGVLIGGLAAGTIYTITETGWDVASITDTGMYLKTISVSPASSNTVDRANRTADVTISSDDTTNVTFTNAREPDNATVDKMVADINDSDSSIISGTGSEHEWFYSADYDVNDEVPFRITVNLPSEVYRSMNSYSITISDVMQNMTYVAGSGRMYAFVKSDTQDEGVWYDVTSCFDGLLPAAGATTFSITKNIKDVTSNLLVDDWNSHSTHTRDYPLTVPSTSTASGNFNSNDIRYLQFRYKATLTNNAIIGPVGNLNTATITFPSGNGGTATDSSSNKVFTYKLVVSKTDSATPANPLSGASFQLYKKYVSADGRSALIPASVRNAGTQSYGANNEITLHGSSLPSALDVSQIVSYCNGDFYYVGDATVNSAGTEFTWNRIDDGIYILIETQAPANYTPLSTAVGLYIDVNHAPYDKTLPGIVSGSHMNVYPSGVCTSFFGNTIEGNTVTSDAISITVPNRQGALSIIKAVTSGSNATDVNFTFNVTLTPPAGTALDPTAFTVTADEGTTVASSSFTRDNDTGVVTGTVVITGAGTATIKGFPEGTVYTVEEDSIPSGWTLVSTEYSNDGTTVGDVTTRTITNDVTDTVTFTNNKTTPDDQFVDITLTKAWNDPNADTEHQADAPADGSVTFQLHQKKTTTTSSGGSVTVQLLAQDLLTPLDTKQGNVGDTVTFTFTADPYAGANLRVKDRRTQYNSENAYLTTPQAGADGNGSFAYTIAESDIYEGVVKLYFAANIVNYTAVTGSGNGQGNSTVTVTDAEGSGYPKTITLSSTNNWAYTGSDLTNLPILTASGNTVTTYEYWLTETARTGDAADYTIVTYADEAGKDADHPITTSGSVTVAVTNSKPAVTTVTATKAWANTTGNTWPMNDSNEYTPEYVEVKLQRMIEGGEFADVEGVDAQRIYPVESGDQHTTATFANLPVDDGNGHDYIYTVVEVTELPGFEVSVTGSNNAFTVTNTKIPTVDITATKEWDNNVTADQQPTAIQFTLYVQADESTYNSTAEADRYTDGTNRYVKVAQNENLVNPAVILRTENEGTVTWASAGWSYLPKYKDAEQTTQNSYLVKETGVYFGALNNGALPDNAVFVAPDMYTVTGGTVAFSGDAGTAVITNAPKTVDVPVEKTWTGLAETDYWEADFKLEEIEVYVAGPTAAYIDRWTDVSPAQTMTIHKGDNEAARTFSGLPMYHIYPNGGVYRIKYAVTETAYVVKANDANGAVIHQWSLDGGLVQGDKYLPDYIHDAGDIDETVTSADDPSYYSIIVGNRRDTRVENESINVSITKAWEGSVPEGAWAKFKLQRKVSEAYKEFTNNYDLSTTCTVTLNGIEYPFVKGSKIYIVAEFASASDSASFTWPGYGNATLGMYNPRSSWIEVTDSFTITMTGKASSVYLTDLHDGETHDVVDTEWNRTNANAAEFTLNSSSWSKSFTDLPSVEVTEVSEGRQTVYTYSYYFVETGSNPTGYYAAFTDTDASGSALGSIGHPVQGRNASIYALNKTIPTFSVEKKWYSLEDPSNYPEIRFTLYQGRVVNGAIQEGTVFVDSQGRSYEDIPLNKNNNWHWNCPAYLPLEDDAGNPVGYYVMEKTSGNNSGHVLVYQNSTFDAQGNVVTYGALLEPGTGEKYDVKPLDYYNNVNSNHACTEDQNFPNGWAGGIAGNEGTLTILNRVPKYMQMDIKKKILMVDSTDGSVKTIMDDPDVEKDIVLEIQLKRRVIDESSGSDVFLTNWENYGVPFMIGFDSSGNPIQQNDNHFVLEWQGYFHWRVVLDTLEANQYGYAQNVGLPAYGYYTKQDGTVIPVRYRYIPEEIGAYRNFNKEPMLNGFEWFVGYQPSAWDGDGNQYATFPPMLPNHDQDRIKNIQGSNLFVEKDWEGIPSNVQEVYVKLYRAHGQDGAAEDVTADIYARMTAYSGYGLIDMTHMSSYANGVLVFQPGDSAIEIRKLAIIADGSKNFNSDPYYYWIEEIAYKDSNGTICTDSSKFAAEYDHYVNGAWSGNWTRTARDNKVSLWSMNGNRMRAANYPTIDVTVTKVWKDENGQTLTGPWNATPAIDHIDVKITRIAQEYDSTNTNTIGDPVVTDLTFVSGETSSQTISIAATGKKLNVSVAEGGGTIYNVESNTGTDARWTVAIDGLQQVYKNRTTGNVWRYSYSVTEVTVLENCGVTITPTSVNAANSTITVENQKQPGSLTITKALAGADSTTDTFTFEVTLTNADNSAYVGNVKVQDATRTTTTSVTLVAADNGKLTVTITGAGSAYITEIPAGTRYEVTETSIPTGWEQTGMEINGGDADRVLDPGETETATITNTKQISIYAQKVWTGLTGWPADVASVTFQLQERAKNAAEGTPWVNAENGEKTVNSSNNPVHWDNLTPTKDYQVVETKITKTDNTEQTVDIVASSSSGTEASPFVITNTVDTISIPVKKNWTGTPPAGTTVEVELVKFVNGSDVSFDPAKKLTLQANEIDDQNWKGTFSGLDKYNTDGTAITYKVKETKVTYLGQEYTATNLTTAFGTTGKESDPIVSTGTISTVTIQNTVETKTISAKKTWNNSETWPTDMSVTFELKQYKGETEQSGFTTTAAANGNETSVTISSQETVNWTNLPKYFLDEQNQVQEYSYKVYETQVLYTGVDPARDCEAAYTVTGEGAGTNGLVTIDNADVTVDVEVTKTWAEQDNIPANTEVTVTLSATVNGAAYALDDGVKTTIKLNGDTTQADDNATAWYYKWNGLPKYDATGNLITYRVTESALKVNGEDVTVADYQVTADTEDTDYSFYLKNRIPTTEIKAKKSWSQNTLPANTSVKLKITATTATYTSDIFSSLIGVTGDQVQTLSGTDATDAATWTATWSGLPRFYLGEEITYTVTETEYKIGDTSYDVANADQTPTSGFDFSFTNTLPTRNIVVEKVWSPTDWPTGIASVTVGLYTMSGDTATPYPDAEHQMTIIITPANSAAEATDTLIAERTFANLPVYDADGNRITYSVQEITVTPLSGSAGTVTNGAVIVNGETWTVTNGPVNNETGIAQVTNNRNVISINVTKQWTKDGTPREDKQSIMFVLYRFLTPVNEGTAPEPNAIRTGEVKYYERTGWETVTISNLPLTVTETVGEGPEATQVTCNVSYYVVETGAAADAGYVLTTEYSNGGANTTAIDAAVNTNSATITIINTETAGVELPATGGMGTTVFYAAGAAITLGAALWLILQRRKRGTN